MRPEVHVPRSPGIQPILIRVDPGESRTEPRLYLDSVPVSTRDLDAVLQKEIVRRPPDWPVYIEGNPDLEWQHVASIIDRVRGLGATAVLLTHRSANGN